LILRSSRYRWFVGAACSTTIRAIEKYFINTNDIYSFDIQCIEESMTNDEAREEQERKKQVKRRLA
jgi:hypothetical protein